MRPPHGREVRLAQQGAHQGGLHQATADIEGLPLADKARNQNETGLPAIAAM